MSTTAGVITAKTVRLPLTSQQKELVPSPIHDLTQLKDERSRTFKHLEKGHITVAPLREPNLILHSHLPHVRYTIAFVDFFDEEVQKNNGDWKKVLEEYLYSGHEPLTNGYVGGRMLHSALSDPTEVLM